MEFGGCTAASYRARPAGAHFAEMLFMGPLAAVALVALQQVHFVAPSPIWLIPVLLVVRAVGLHGHRGFWWDRSHTRVRLHARIATQVILVTAIIYATGWGPALAIGLVLVGQESLAMTGSVVLPGGARLDLRLPGRRPGAGGPGLGPQHATRCRPSTDWPSWWPSASPSPTAPSTRPSGRRKRAASLTESRERRFRALVQSSSDLVFALDRTRTVTYASPSSTKVLGFEPDELLGLAHR